MSSATAAAAAAAGDGSDDTFDASSGGDNLLVECLVCMGEHLRSHIAVCHTASCDFAVCFSCACKLQGTHVCDNYGNSVSRALLPLDRQKSPCSHSHDRGVGMGCCSATLHRM